MKLKIQKFGKFSKMEKTKSFKKSKGFKITFCVRDIRV